MRAMKIIGLGLAIMLAGCAELNSIHRQTNFPAAEEGKIVTIDAKQRHIVLAPETDPNIPTKWRACAEAAPDVFSALASSGALTLDVSDKVSGEGSFAVSETAAVIQRTQTINLLRESFFRTCERYLSGAMNRTQMLVQAARDQRSMVSILAIEQLTGAVRPASTIISGPGTTAAALSGTQAAAIVQDYITRRNEAEATRDAKKKIVETAKKKGGVCADDDGSDPEECTELTTALEGAEAELIKAQGGLNDAIALAKDLTRAASAGTSGGSTGTDGITMSDLNPSHLATVAPAVVAIAHNATINEPLMFCIAFFTDPEETVAQHVDAASKQSMVDGCMDILKTQQARDNVISAQLSFQAGANEQRLARYLDPSLPAVTFTTRMNTARQALKTLTGKDDATSVMTILAQGPEAMRAALIGEIRKIEKDKTALEALN